jgi:hypothetical protein
MPRPRHSRAGRNGGDRLGQIAWRRDATGGTWSFMVRCRRSSPAIHSSTIRGSLRYQSFHPHPLAPQGTGQCRKVGPENAPEFLNHDCS